MKYLKKFVRFMKESSAAAEMPAFASDTKTTEPATKPKVPTKPTKPKPKEDEERIQKPSIDPERKAVTEQDVVNRFIEEMHKKGQSIKKYM